MKYSCKSGLLRAAHAYDLQADRLVQHGPAATVDILFSDISEIVLFKERRPGSPRSYRACKIMAGRNKLVLTSAHRTGLLRTQDRTGFYNPFIKQLIRLALTSNPSIRFIDRESWWILDALLLSIRALTRHLPRRAAANVWGVTAQRIGPWLSPHRHALDQLDRLCPTRTPRQKQAIIRGMWDGLGRTLSDYGHVRELLPISPDRPSDGEVVVDDFTVELARHMDRDRRGALVFTAHLGNWEIPAMMLGRITNREIAVIYRRQRGRMATGQLTEARSQYIGRQIEADHTAPRKLSNAVRDGCLVGILMDQHDADGVEVSFFGQACRVSPLLARLARVQNCPVYGTRAIRLADQKYRFELIGPLQLPRDTSGKIDVQAAMQAVFSVLEAWIQEHPEQWMWFRRIAR